MTLGQRADTASVQAIEREFRLNQPWYKRLYFYFNDLSPVSADKLSDENHPTYIAPNQAHFVKLFTVGEKTIVLKKPDLGRSFQSRRKVSEVLSEKVFATAILALFAMLIASVIGIVIGVFVALRQYSFWDNFILTSSVIGISQPAFFSAFLIAIIFGYYLSAITGLNHQGSLVVLNDYGDEVDESIVISHNWEELRRFMWDYVGIVRTNKRLQRAQHRIRLLAREIDEFYSNFRVSNDLIELRNLVVTADLIVRSALQRKESRGLHFSRDYPQTLPKARDTVLRPRR